MSTIALYGYEIFFNEILNNVSSSIVFFIYLYYFDYDLHVENIFWWVLFSNNKVSYSCYSHAAFLTRESNIDGFYSKGPRGFLMNLQFYVHSNGVS